MRLRGPLPEIALAIITLVLLVALSYKLALDVFLAGLALTFVALSVLTALPSAASGAGWYPLTSVITCDFNRVVLILLVIINF